MEVGESSKLEEVVIFHAGRNFKKGSLLFLVDVEPMQVERSAKIYKFE